MLQPVGPLPPQVYWRRRLMLVGGLIVVLLLALAMCSGGGASPGGTGGGTGTGVAPSGSITPSASAAATITVSPGTAGGPAQGPAPTSSQPSPTTSSQSTPTVPGSGGPPTSDPLATTVPQPCPDNALTVTASPAKPSYRVGETPALKLTARNTGAVACVRDVGPRQQEMLLYEGVTRIWSSNDCYPDGGTDVRTLSPGESVSSTVVWSGLSSQPGCAGTRTRVKAGSYDLVARVGSATSKPATLVLQ